MDTASFTITIRRSGKEYSYHLEAEDIFAADKEARQRLKKGETLTECTLSDFEEDADKNFAEEQLMLF